MLLPPDLREWVPEDDVVHFVLEVVVGMNLPALKINRRGSGSEQYPPKMMLQLLIYCHANGIFSSRRIERAAYRDVAVRFLTADTHHGHDTICTFGRENFEAVSEQADYEKKVQDRDRRSGKSKGRRIKPPKDTPDDHEQINLTDPESRLMRKIRREGYTQSCNSQAAVDADGSQLILSKNVTTCASDGNELEPAVFYCRNPRPSRKIGLRMLHQPTSGFILV